MYNKKKYLMLCGLLNATDNQNKIIYLMEKAQ